MKNDDKDKKRILVADDEPRIRDLLRIVLESRGFAVSEAEDGAAALKEFAAAPPDMVVLDVMMPGMDGFECCRQLRSASDCPIIMLTAKGEDYDVVQGLECGADDYIVKPFTPMVLVARVQALLRRSGKDVKPRDVFGGLAIDREAREVRADGAVTALSRREYDLLVYLADNYNISLSRDQILESVWGYDYLGSSNTVDTHVGRLRTKLGKCGAYIITLRGYGYRFEVERQ
jgi:two-component system response regulator ResD